METLTIVKELPKESIFIEPVDAVIKEGEYGYISAHRPKDNEKANGEALECGSKANITAVYLSANTDENGIWTLGELGIETPVSSLEIMTPNQGVIRIFKYDPSIPTGKLFGEKSGVYVLGNGDYIPTVKEHVEFKRTNFDYEAPILPESFKNACKSIPLNESLPDTPLSLNEFLKLSIPPLEFLVEGFIQKNGKCMISAPTNVGKSILTQNLCLDVAHGRPFLGKFPTIQTNVLYLDLEMGNSAVQQRFKIMTSNSGCDNLFVKHIPALNLLDEPQQAQVSSWVKDLNIGLIVLDPLRNAWFGNENDQQESRNLQAFLNTLIADHKTTVLVVHHWRKATKDFKTGGEMASGSSGWAGWLDNHWTIEGSNTLKISNHKQRSGQKIKPFITQINPETLKFEYLNDCEPKFDDSTLEKIFNLFESPKVSIPEIRKKAVEDKICSKTTIDRLIKETKLFIVDSSQKTHFLMKNVPINAESTYRTITPNVNGAIIEYKNDDYTIIPN